MAWYGNHVDASRKLEQLIDQKPNLEQLLNFPDFIQQLKAYNPKLLEYLTTSNTIIQDLINYLTLPPQTNETYERKHKLPTLSIEMVQSQAMSVINSFFKQCEQFGKKKYLILMFQQALSEKNKVDNHILPLLAGYFLRVNICLLNNKYKETIDCIYSQPQIFNMLLANSESLSITNSLQVYLNLDLTKNSQQIPERLNLKIKTISNIMNLLKETIKLQNQSQYNEEKRINQTNALRVQNLSSILIQLLEKYYLIADGKEMIDQVLTKEQNVEILFGVAERQPKATQGAYYDVCVSVLNVLISIMKYYSFSSMNTQQLHNQQANKRNQESLEKQPFIRIFTKKFPILIKILQQKLSTTNQNEIKQSQQLSHLNIYHSKIIQLINISLQLNSQKIFLHCIKNYQYIELLLKLLFIYEKCNILHIMIEKLFLMIFRTQRNLNQTIKHYIFCDAAIIDRTAGQYMKNFISDEELLKSMGYGYRRKGYFGYLMKLMKIYSGIQTQDKQIVNAIKNKSEIWNKISRMVLKPLQAISMKELSTYEGVPPTIPIEYSVKSIVSMNDDPKSQTKKQMDSSKVIEQINRQEIIQNLKSLENIQPPENKLEAQNLLASHNVQNSGTQSKNEDQFFKTPAQLSLNKQQTNNSDKSYQKLQQTQQKQQNHETIKKVEQYENNFVSNENQENYNSPGIGRKSSSGYNDFIQIEKKKAQTQIRKQRSRSKDRQLSKGRTRMTSPSPSKRVNKWSEGQDNNKSKQKISLTSNTSHGGQKKNLPRIPNQKKGLNVSSNSTTSNPTTRLKSQQSFQNPVKKQKPSFTSPLSSEEKHNKSMQIQNGKQNSQFLSDDSKKYSKSMLDLDSLKKVKIIYRFEAPQKKQFRKINQEDKQIFDMLGINYQ